MNETNSLEDCDEVLLWRAVIAQAFTDATTQIVARVYSSSTLSVEGRSEARRFLLSPLNPWRENRHFVCHLSGFDPEQVEERARKLLGPIIAAEIAAEGQRVETDVDRDKREALANHIEAGGTIDPHRRGSKLRKKPKPALKVMKPKRLSADQMLAWIEQNETSLIEIGEIDIALAEAAKRESQSVAQRARQARDKLVAQTSFTPALAAE